MSDATDGPDLPATAALYNIFGLCLSLPFPAPLLSPAPPQSAVDLQVTLGATPQRLPQLFHAFHTELLDADIQIGEQGDMLWSTRRARLWASHGHTLVVGPFGNLKPTLFRRFILFICLP